MGIAEILGLFAFGIALIALWMVSDVLKKVELRNEQIVKTHIQPLRREVNDIDDKLQKLAKVVAAGETRQKATDGAAAEQIIAFETQLKTIASEIQALDQSIPKQYRIPAQARPKSIQ